MSLKKHPNWNAEDFAYLIGKGYKEHEIKKIWDRDAKRGHGPQKHTNKAPNSLGLAKPTGFTRYENVDQEIDAYLEEKKLTPAEKDKREEIAKAMERDNPGMPMDKKMAIATAQAKKVAEAMEVDRKQAKKDYKDAHRGGLGDQLKSRQRQRDANKGTNNPDPTISKRALKMTNLKTYGAKKPNLPEETSLQRAQRIVAESRYDQWGSARPSSTGDGASKGRGSSFGGSRRRQSYSSRLDDARARNRAREQEYQAKKKEAEHQDRVKAGGGTQLKLKLESFSAFLDEAVSVDKKDYSWGKMMTVKHGKSHQFPLHPEHQSALRKLKDGDKTSFKDETGSHIKAHRKGDTVHLKHPGSNKTTPVAHSHFAESIEIEEGQGEYFIVQHKTKGHSVEMRAKSGLHAREEGAKKLKAKAHEVDVMRKYQKESVEHIEEASTKEVHIRFYGQLTAAEKKKVGAAFKKYSIEVTDESDKGIYVHGTRLNLERLGRELPQKMMIDDDIYEEVAVNAVSGGGVDMNTNGGYHKRDKRKKNDPEYMYRRNLKDVKSLLMGGKS